jgi:N-glycosylase/DNA lyase
MKITITDDFDLKKIENSGQCFRVRELPDGRFRFVTGTDILYILPLVECDYEVSCDEREWQEIWNPYFDLSRNYKEIRGMVPPEDEFMGTAAGEGTGIRILKQDPWEMLITFIISQRKSIPAIKQSVEMLSERFGTPVETEYEKINLFPTPEQLRAATGDDYKECKLGYRVSYALDAVAAVNENRLDLLALYKADDAGLFDTLKTVKGVGDKVSNCICLFAYGRTAMAPVDTWIAKVIDEHYKGVNPFPAYGEVAGIMQQYAFYHAQIHKK